MLVDSLKEILEEKISDPLEAYRRIAAAIMLLAAKLDADTGVADTALPRCARGG